MDIEGIVFIILGVLSIAIGIFGKFRPDIVYRDRDKNTAFGGAFRQFGFSTFRVFDGKMDSELKQRIGFVVYILMGLVFITIGLLR